MKKNYFLPHYCSFIGWGLLLCGVVFLVLCRAEVIPELNVTVLSAIPMSTFAEDFAHGSLLTVNDINDELGTVAIMVGLILIAFSSEKDDDELTDALRLRSWYLAGITYGVVYILFDLLVYGIPYLNYMWFVQGGLLLLIYIVIFKSKLYVMRRSDDGQ